MYNVHRQYRNITRTHIYIIFFLPCDSKMSEQTCVSQTCHTVIISEENIATNL